MGDWGIGYWVLDIGCWGALSIASIQGKKKRTRTAGVASLADASRSTRSMGYCGGCSGTRQWRGWGGRCISLISDFGDVISNWVFGSLLLAMANT